MKVLIFEDEKYTAIRMVQLLKKYDPEIEIMDIINSVQKGIEWFKKNSLPDLIFQDIILNDGNCFEIYDTIKINAPVIFTTAYDEYALRSFKVNSIDFLVKPYDYNDIKEALDKFIGFREIFIPPDSDLLRKIIQPGNNVYKKRFLIKIGDRFQSIKTDDIAWFVFEEGLTFAFTFDNTKFPIDFSIEQISGLLDQDQFFKINRKYVLNIDSIRNIYSYFNSRLKLEISPKPAEDIIVSRERVKDFKAWLGR